MDLLVEGLDGGGRMLRLLLHIFNVGTQFGRGDNEVIEGLQVGDIL
jgi:hypothetical protein